LIRLTSTSHTLITGRVRAHTLIINTVTVTVTVTVTLVVTVICLVPDRSARNRRNMPLPLHALHFLFSRHIDIVSRQTIVTSRRNFGAWYASRQFMGASG
jgi:hypothetical protein